MPAFAGMTEGEVPPIRVLSKFYIFIYFSYFVAIAVGLLYNRSMDQELTPHESLEREMRELSADIKIKGAGEHKDVLRAAVGERIGIQGGAQASGNANTQQATPSPVHQSLVLPKYAEDMPEEVQLLVETLIDKAWHKGIDAATADARKAGPVILDMFHDSLTGKLYEEMHKRGML